MSAPFQGLDSYPVNRSDDDSDRLLEHREFPRTPPQRAMVLAALFGAACLWAVVTWVSHTPWLGLELASDTNGIRVTAVTAGGPADGRLAPGDRLVALRTMRGEMLSLDGASLVDDPDIYPTYAAYNAFFSKQKALYAALSAQFVTAVLSDGREVMITPSRTRPLPQLPWDFWAMATFSILVLQVGAGMWAFRRGKPATRLVALTGVGYMISTLTFAIYATREWVLNPSIFWWLAELNHLGNMTFSYAALALLWHYPRLMRPFPFAQLCLLMACLVWFNELGQLFQWPLHAFYLQYFVPYLAGMWVARAQWNATRQRPDERAALQWFLLSLLATIGVVMLLYFVPELFDRAPLIPPWVGQLMLSVLYLGLVLGVLRFRLFDLERWWFTAWLWFLGGLVVMLVDVTLMYVADLRPTGALSLSIIVAGWIYFPTRQWLWSKFVRSPSLGLEAYLPMLLEAFFSASTPHAYQERWQELLIKIFDPLDARPAATACAQMHLEESGVVLAVPHIQDDGHHVRLSGRSRGNRLFTPDDVQLASSILTIARKSVGLCAAHERGAAVERERIARDLHDDVAPHLLTLIHLATNSENAERARTALQTLRESIYTINDPRERPLEEVVADWRVETTDRAEAAGVQLEWHQPDDLNGSWLTPRQRLNLTRVLREAVTNALRHAMPTRLEVAIAIAGQSLTVALAHDGQTSLPVNWCEGNGLKNMRTRIGELNGQIEWRVERLPPSGDLASIHVIWNTPLAPHVTPSLDFAS